MQILTEEIVEISSGDSRAVIMLKGAYVRSITLNGTDLLKESHDGKDTHGGMAMLLPFANRVRDARFVWDKRTYQLPKNNGEHSIHGLTRDVDWIVKHRGKESVSLWYKIDSGEYPVALFLKVTYTVSDTAFRVDIEASNEGQVPAPFMAGMHPYFLFDGEWKLRGQSNILRLNYKDKYFPDGSFVPYNPEKIGSSAGETYDDTFIAGDSIILVTGDRKVMVRNIRMPFLVVYSGEYAQGKSVALEPMTGAPDSFNNGIGLVTIDPGESFNCSAIFEIYK